jgi:hypothetical protein
MIENHRRIGCLGRSDEQEYCHGKTAMISLPDRFLVGLNFGTSGELTFLHEQEALKVFRSVATGISGG